METRRIHELSPHRQSLIRNKDDVSTQVPPVSAGRSVRAVAGPRGPGGCLPPGNPKIRTCAIDESGSSVHGFATRAGGSPTPTEEAKPLDRREAVPGTTSLARATRQFPVPDSPHLHPAVTQRRCAAAKPPAGEEPVRLQNQHVQPVSDRQVSAGSAPLRHRSQRPAGP